MKITFYGAARTVTGSCHMVETNGKKFLVDCGMFQGKLSEQMRNYDEFPFDVNSVDFVILTHAHIDHSGRIPKLYKEGYKNPIYATSATVDLCGIMLPDSGFIQEKEIEWVNKKRIRAGKKPNDPMYTAQDAKDSLKLFKGIEYNQLIKIDDSVSFRMIDAGHMLGSSIVEVFITENGVTKKIVFSGDLGNQNIPIIKDPTYEKDADYLVIESTYGDRLHGKMEDYTSKFINIILDTIDRGGNLIIPSFAVGRTQEMLYEINKYDAIKEVADRLKKIPVYVDSPLAVNATKIFEENPEYYDNEALNYVNSGDNPLEFDNLHFITTAEQSKALNDDPTPKIIISASGMCEVGRIKHHLKHNLFRPESTILFVGYQAEGTLGKRILAGEKIVKIFGDEIVVKAHIESIDAFSGHADKDGLIDWISKFEKKPKNIFIVHGEYPVQQIFRRHIKESFNIDSIIPDYEESYSLDGNLIESKQNAYTSNRLDVLESLADIKQEIDKLSNDVKSELKNNIKIDELASIREKIATLKNSINFIKK